jgi:hypothetical protein
MCSANKKKKHLRELAKVLTNARESISQDVREHGYETVWADPADAEYEKSAWKPKVNLTIQETQQWEHLRSQDEEYRRLIASVRQDLKLSIEDISDHAHEFMTRMNRSHRFNAVVWTRGDCLLL